MTTFFNLVLAGLTFGAIYMLLALGVVLIYRVSRVVNLAHGAMGVLAVYVFHYVFLQSWGLPVGLAFALTLVVGAVIGAAVERVFIGPVRRDGVLVMLIMTVGILLLLTESALQVWGPDQPVVASIFSGRTVRFLDTGVTFHQMGAAGLALSLGALLAWALNRTRFGKAIEAVAEDADAAYCIGLPVRTLTTVTWALGGASAALAGLLFIHMNSLDPISLTFVLMPALVAAVFGGFASFGLAAAGSLVIGVVYALSQGYTTVAGMGDAVVFVVLIGALLLNPAMRRTAALRMEF